MLRVRAARQTRDLLQSERNALANAQRLFLGRGRDGSRLPNDGFVGATLLGAAFATGAGRFAADRYNFFNRLSAMPIRRTGSANDPFQRHRIRSRRAGSRLAKSQPKRGSCRFAWNAPHREQRTTPQSACNEPRSRQCTLRDLVCSLSRERTASGGGGEPAPAKRYRFAT